MRITEQRTVPKDVTVKTVCDGCGEEVDGEAPRSWEHFMSGHSEWGNESCDSVEWHDACSLSCLAEVARTELRYMSDPLESLKVAGLNVELLRDLIELVEVAP